MSKPELPAPAHGESTAPQPPTPDSSTTGVQTNATVFHGEPTATTPPSDDFNAGASSSSNGSGYF